MFRHVLSRRRNELAATVARQLRNTEAATDAALANAAELMRLMASSNAEGRFAAEEGQEVLLRATASWNAMIASRGEIVGTHKALLGLAERFSIDPVSWGGLVGKSEEAHGGLTIIAGASEQQAA